MFSKVIFGKKLVKFSTKQIILTFFKNRRSFGRLNGGFFERIFARVSRGNFR